MILVGVFHFFDIKATKKWLLTALTALTVITVIMALYIIQPRPLHQLDLKIYDTLLPLRRNAAPSPVPMIVDIDEASLAVYGQWPWPRYLLAELIDKIAMGGTASIGLDVLLAEEDRSSPRLMEEYLKRDKDVAVVFRGLPKYLLDYDILLAQTLRETGAFLGAFANFDIARPLEDAPPTVGFIERGSPDAVPFVTHLLKAQSAVLPLPVLQQGTAIGFVNISPDMDGIVRQVPLLLQLGDTVYPSLALRTLMGALGVKNLTVFTGPDGLEAVRLGAYTVPVTPAGSMFVPFQGPRKTYPYISAKDILLGKVSDDTLRDKVVFLGSSAPGLLDIRSTPLDRIFPGVEAHASVVDAILTANSIRVPSWTPGLQIMA